MNSKPSEPSFLDIFKRKTVPLVVFVLVCCIVGYAASSRQASRYAVTTEVGLAPPGSAAIPGTEVSTGIDLVRYTRNESVIMGGPEVFADATALVKAKGVTDISIHVVATPSQDSDFVDLTVTAASPTAAVKASDAIVQAYKDRRRASLEAARKPIEAKRVALQAAVTQLEDAAKQDPAVLDATRSQFAQATTDVAAYDLAITDGQFGIASYLSPKLPTAPSSPKPKQSALFGAVFGLVLGAGWVYSSVLRAPRSLYPKHAVGRLGAPLLSEIASSSAFRPSKPVQGDEDRRRDAYARAVSLCLGQLADGLPVIGVTAPGVNRSAVSTLHVAEAASVAGWQVTVVDADPSARLVAYLGGNAGAVDRKFRVVSAPGLTRSTTGTRWFDEVLDDSDPDGLVLVNFPDLIRQPASVPLARHTSGVLTVVNRRTLLVELDEFRVRARLLDLAILGVVFDDDTRRDEFRASRRRPPAPRPLTSSVAVRPERPERQLRAQAPAKR